jgi:BirA family biotin operon repressor/biotin-[acetyl-CoA-carboxylase] ligase
MDFTFVRFDSIDSTNAEAMREARLGAAEGVCIVANAQTAGRGRHGREWRSDPGSGLYFSLVLRPKLKPEQLPLITLMAGVAACDALRTLNIEADIKWVNDLLVKEKKIGGVLCETAETPTGVAVVVGIGINVLSSMLTGELAETATSIEREIPQGSENADMFSSVEASLKDFIAKYYAELQGENGPDAILESWRQRSTYHSGKAVRVTTGNETFDGVTDGIEANGALRVKREDGRVTIVSAGDVQRLRATH